MTRFRLQLSAALLAALVVTSLASAEVVERVRVAEPGRTVTASLPPGVFLLLTSPPDYLRAQASATEGSWVGPAFAASGKPDLGGRASIDWKVRFESTTRNTEDAARAALELGWKETLRGGISVPHVVAGRTVGTFDGDFVLTVSDEADASHEAAMAFPIAPRLYAVVNFRLTAPSRTSAGEFGEFFVNAVRATTWNRGQAIRSLSGVRIQGNLPPTRVTVRGDARRVTGTVADAFRHPLLGARVVLDRRTGQSWRRLTATKTNTRGEFAIRVGARGAYRVTAFLGSVSLTGPTVRAG